MAGSATLTAVESSPATNEPMIAATSASCLLWLAGAATAVGPMVPTLDGYASGRSKRAAPARRRLSTNLDQGSLINGLPIRHNADLSTYPLKWNDQDRGPSWWLVKRPRPGGHVLVQVVAEGRA